MNGPPFRFRLERVRAVRERKEKLAKQDLAQSLSHMSSCQDQLRSTEAELQDAQAEHRSAVSEPGTLGADELLARQIFLERVEAERRAQALQLQHSESEVSASAARLATAAGEHQMLERLRERRRREHAGEAARRESNALDEIAAARFGRGTA